MRDEFGDFQRGFQKRASFLKADMKDFEIVNGGYREFLSIEMWIVPEGAQPPELTPTVDEKDVIFRKGRPQFFRSVCDWIG